MITFQMFGLGLVYGVSTIFQLYQSFIGGNLSTRTTDLPQVTDKVYHIMLYLVHLAMKEI